MPNAHEFQASLNAKSPLVNFVGLRVGMNDLHPFTEPSLPLSVNSSIHLSIHYFIYPSNQLTVVPLQSLLSLLPPSLPPPIHLCLKVLFLSISPPSCHPSYSADSQVHPRSFFFSLLTNHIMTTLYLQHSSIFLSSSAALSFPALSLFSHFHFLYFFSCPRRPKIKI